MYEGSLFHNAGEETEKERYVFKFYVLVTWSSSFLLAELEDYIELL